MLSGRRSRGAGRRGKLEGSQLDFMQPFGGNARIKRVAMAASEEAALRPSRQQKGLSRRGLS